MNRSALGRQIDEVLGSTCEVWEKALLVEEIAAAHRTAERRAELELARIRAETIRAERAFRWAEAAYRAKKERTELDQLRRRADTYAAELVSRGIDLPVPE